jgi:hypothetical protein
VLSGPSRGREQAWKADNRLFTLVSGPARFLEELTATEPTPASPDFPKKQALL